jgi:hypothetical protein
MRTYLVRLSILTLLLAFCLGATISILPAPDAHATPRAPLATILGLGHIDLRGYCQQSLGKANVTTVGSTAYDWRCVDQNGAFSTFSMRNACEWQYGNRLVNALDVTYDFYSTTSWQCYRITSQLGGINLQAFCQATGYVSVTTVGSTAYDWRCVDQNGATSVLSMPLACSWQYNNTNVIARFADFYSVTSWACWL